MSEHLLKYSLKVYVKPMGKPRMTRADVWKKRPCVVRYREFCDKIRMAARKAGKVPPMESVDLISITSVFAYPKSWKAKKREEMRNQRHRYKPDVDNIAKGIMDALFHEDSGIADLHAYKRWGNEDCVTVDVFYVAD